MKSACYSKISLAVAGVLLAVAGGAHAQSVEDKLRSQLRATAQQLRQLQDNQAQLQADKATAEEQRDKALAQLKDAQAQLETAKGSAGEQAAAQRALALEKSARARDAQELAKYKASNDELSNASRTLDAQRLQLQKDAKQRDAQLQACEAKNAELYRVGHEILDAYEHIGLGSLFASRQPFARAARVQYDDIAQRYGDTLYANKYDPAARAAAAASGVPAAAASEPSAIR